MKNFSTTPHNIVPHSHQIVGQWAPVLEDLNRAFPPEGYQVDVPYDQMREDISRVLHGIFDFVIALQHYPDLVTKMLSGISLRFLSVIGTVSNRAGKIQSAAEVQYLCPPYSRQTLPFTVFFLKNPQHRNMAITGDILLSGCPMGTKEQWVITDRVYNASRRLMYYSHGLGIDTRSHIGALTELLKVKFPYDKLLIAHARYLKRRRHPGFESLFDKDACDPTDYYLFGNPSKKPDLMPEDFRIR